MEFEVSKMSCGHCTAAIEKSVKQADPAASVSCDISSHRVRVDSDLSREAIAAAISDAGYDPVSVPA